MDLTSGLFAPTPPNLWIYTPFTSSCATPFSYVLDGRQESNISINRLITIPMPMRGMKATLRTRTGPNADVLDEAPTSKFAAMSSIDVAP